MWYLIVFSLLTEKSITVLQLLRKLCVNFRKIISKDSPDDNPIQLLPSSSVKIFKTDSRKPLSPPTAKVHLQSVARAFLWKQSKRQPDMFKRRWCTLDMKKGILSFARNKGDETPRTIINLKEGLDFLANFSRPFFPLDFC